MMILKEKREGRVDGGQAFPQPVTVGPNDDLYPAYPGMTLRDHFAGLALSSIAANVFDFNSYVPIPEQIAEWAYQLADAMLAERAK